MTEVGLRLGALCIPRLLCPFLCTHVVFLFLQVYGFASLSTLVSGGVSTGAGG